MTTPSTFPPIVTPRPAGSGRQLTLTIIGGILAVIGGLASAAAIALIAVFGSSGSLDSGSHQVTTSASALITDVNHIQNTSGVGAITGWPTVRLTASGGNASGVFIGIGRAADVDRYLAAVGFDEATDFSVRPFELTTTRHPGDASAAPPTGQTFWVASADSRTVANLTWKVQNGDYRIVVMNADGSPNVNTQVRIELTLPNAFQISLIVLASGLLVVGIGVVVLVRGFTRGRRQPALGMSSHL